ncbi:MAG: L,D-transpeptidase [Acidobacteriota bacterium]
MRRTCLVLPTICFLFWTGHSESRAEETTHSDRRVVVSLVHRKLAVVQGDRVLKIYPVAIGSKSSPSPTGEFKIVHRIPKPTYYAPGIVIPPGRRNPLGTRWIGLSLKGFGIHGTNQPGSIGKAASHGCIRLRNRDAEELFDIVSVGNVVELHGESSPDISHFFEKPSEEPAQQPRTETQLALVTTGH